MIKPIGDNSKLQHAGRADSLFDQLDFALVDVDAVLKLEGINEQIDYGHFPLERMEAIAREVTNALLEREVIG